MEMVLLTLFLVVLVALFGFVTFLYMREAGENSAQLWLTGSQRLRQSIGNLGAAARQAGPQRTRTDAAALESRDEPVTTGEIPRQLTARDVAMALEDDALRSLREEIQQELRVAVGRTREFDARLTRIEQATTEVPQVSAAIEQEIASLREGSRTEIERLQVTIESVRQRAGAWGERRGQALSDLYGSLARVESALAAVIHPMLLPGEPLSLPTEIPDEAMDWDSWGDVGERAYAFGNVFNENRLVLDRDTADEIEAFIALLRQALTGSVYPAVRVARPNADQVARMRSGLEAIVAELPVVRRTVETAYREDST
jgi:hypothetical protein